MTSRPTAWSGASVGITGGLGFIGSALAIELSSSGAEIEILDSLEEGSSARLANVQEIQAGARVTLGDLSSPEVASDFVNGKDLIFNLAGQSGHLVSMDDPAEDLRCNVATQISLIEACASSPRKPRVVHVSTRQVYGRPIYSPVDESHPVKPVDVNGIHKLSGEMHHLLAFELSGFRTSIIRLSNTYGPRMRISDSRQNFLGPWFRAAAEGREFSVFGDGSQTRELLFVDDAVQALLAVADTEACVGEIVNLAGNNPIPLAQIAEMLCQEAGGGNFRFEPFPDKLKKIDIGSFATSTQKLFGLTGWEPRIELPEGFRATLSHIRALDRERESD